MAKQEYRLRIRTRTSDPGAPRWIVGHTLYSLHRAHRRMAQLRRAGHIVHLDMAGKGWH